MRAPRSLLLGLLAIAVVQIAVIALGDSRVYSGSDAGGRAAAVQAASVAGGCDHSLGYWAQPWDPDGRFHPMVNSVAGGADHRQPASVLLVCPAASLTGWFGLPWALVVPVLGVLLAGAGAWSLARTLGGSGTVALLLVGLVGPLAPYGADVWEHAPAVGCGLLGTALFVGRRSVSTGALAGVLWGLAVGYRSETALVALALALVVLLAPEVRSRLLGDRVRSAVGAVAAAAVLLADRLAQQAVVGADVRSARVSGQVGSALDGLVDRGRDALVTTAGAYPTYSDGAAIGLGALLVVLLLVLGAAVVGAPISAWTVRVVLPLAAVLALLRLREPGFVPGMFVAAPVAACGAVGAFRTSDDPLRKALARGALLALPLVWAVQWRGDLAAQWGGRYVLLSGSLLTVVGVVHLGRRGSRPAAAGLVVLAVLIGGMGLAWHVQRTHRIAEVVDDLLAAPCEEVLISTSTPLLREGGSIEEIRTGVRSDGCRLLTAGPADLADALEVARASGARTASVLEADPVGGMPDALLHEVVERSVPIATDPLVLVVHQVNLDP